LAARPCREKMAAMTPDELIDAVCPRIRDLGWAYYFVDETGARAEELGLDFLSFYFIGRGGVLGDVEASVARAAFGYFEPGLFTTMWELGRSRIEPRVAAREHFALAAEHGRRRLSDIGDLDDFCAAADRVNDAADDTALALYAGFKAEPMVDDSPGRAMQLLAVLRELRGSAHLLALRSVGLDTLVAHAIVRPNDLAMFGWSSDDVPGITDADRSLRDEAEALTDRIVRPAYAMLDEAAQQVFIDGLDRIHVALTR
jgi:hypothetical protein